MRRDVTPAAVPWPDAVLADRVNSLYAHTGSSLLGNGLGAVIVGWLFQGAARIQGDAVPWTGWLAAFAVLWLLRLAMALAFRRLRPTGEIALVWWRRAWLAGALANGALWGGAAWVFYGHGEAIAQTALVLIISGLCVGSIPSLAAQGRVYLAYVALALLPLVLRLAWAGDGHSLALAAVSAMVLATALLLGRNFRQSFERLMQLQAQAVQLNAQLRRETVEADAARQRAVEATQAKTRFFAAASHDLRQPLQALTLFTQAVHEQNQAPALVPLIAKLGSAVNALETLFTELLDVSRLDAGGVVARPREVLVADLFRPLRLHFEPVAFDKGLAFKLHGAQRVVHADPLLVERILRNLCANAIAHTHDGGVLVAARSRGDRVLLQVWDSGVGIPAEALERIFDEFVQLGGAESSTGANRGKRPGLGLGLAIVRRLAGLMDAPLQVRSVPGRGTVFSLSLPAANTGPKPAG